MDLEKYRKQLLEKIHSVITKEQEAKVTMIYTNVIGVSVLETLLNFYEDIISELYQEMEEKEICKEIIKEFIENLKEIIGLNGDGAGKDLEEDEIYHSPEKEE